MEQINNSFSVSDKIIYNISKCLKPYMYVFPENIIGRIDHNEIGKSIGKVVSSATFELNKEISSIALVEYCSFCDITKREARECLYLYMLKTIFEDPRIGTFSADQLKRINPLMDTKELICVSCLKTIIFNKNPISKFYYLSSNRTPKILSVEDLSKEVFIDEDFSLYFDSFNDNV